MTSRFHPFPLLHSLLRGRDSAPIQPDPPSELNYSPAPLRIPRTRVLGLSYMAGLLQHGMTQNFYTAFLPPPIIRRATVIPRRTVGGAWGAGTVGQATSHVPSARIPRTIT